MKLSTIKSTTTIAARSLHCFEFIHFQLQLATTLFVIALVLSKLVSLAEGNTTTMSDADHVGQKESRESTAAAATTTVSAPSLLRIHSFPALVCNYTLQ